MRFRNSLQKLKKWHVAVTMVLLLAVNLTMMGISFARYRTVYEKQHAIGVAGFSPALEENTFEGNFEFGGESLPVANSFTVRNGNTKIGLQLTVTVIPEGILPFSYRLFLGEEELSMEEKDGALVATVEMPVGTAEQEFVLVTEWNSPEYDEHFGGLVEHVKIRVLCEQAEGGGV